MTAKKKTHYGKPFNEYKNTSGPPKKGGPPTKVKPPGGTATKPKPPGKKKTKKAVYLGDVAEPNLKGQSAVKKKKRTKKKVLNNPGGVAGYLRDRDRKQAERIAKMFKK